ncbi:MAG: 2-keto-4-pentenoate hydratase, partial [Methyloglobulus sp.]|nr:2-keto-4-pentenoate hydratase [Methyloglobulus sp.]
AHIKLIVLVNDVSLRNLIPDELAKGFGFLHGKPASAFSPVAVTPDELGTAWNDSKLHLSLKVYWNEQLVGNANAGADMQFSFVRLIHHAAKSRKLTAGTIIGSGTVSNYDSTKGYSCIVEKRVVETIETGAVITGYLRFGDKVKIEMLDGQGCSIFGAIEQEVKPCR